MSSQRDDAPHRVVLVATGLNALSYLPDGRHVVSGSFEGTVAVWNAENGQQKGPSMQHVSEVYALAVTRDGTRIVSCDEHGRVHVWDTDTHASVKAWTHPEHIPCLAISPDGRRIAVGFQTVSLHVVDEGRHTIERTMQIKKGMWCMAFSPDGRSLACGAEDGIRVYDTDSGTLILGPLAGHKDTLWSLIWSHDGGRIFSGSRDKTIYCWNIDTGQLIGRPWTGHTDYITSLALSPDGSILASASWDHTVRFWYTTTGSSVRPPLLHECGLSAICFAPSNEFLALAGLDGKIYFWRLRTMGRRLGLMNETGVRTGLSPPPNLTPYIFKENDQYIAGGGFGDVYRCWYRADVPKEVAVKAFRFAFALDGDTCDKPLQMLRRELGIWRRLDHPNIVPFLGVAYGFGMHGAMSLVSLWMPNGSLHHFLERYHHHLDSGHRLQLLLEVASGLHYLHSLQIVHGDLNCNNVLLDNVYVARLSDFGYASLVGTIPEALTYLQRSTTRPGALRWIAPEQIDPDASFDRTPKSDIYAFGCVALQARSQPSSLTLFQRSLQVFSGRQPWSEVRQDAAVVLCLARGQTPRRPACDTLDDARWDFVSRCWSAVETRPDAEAIVTAVARLLGTSPRCSALRHVVDAWARGLDLMVAAPDGEPTERIPGTERQGDASPWFDRRVLPPTRLSGSPRETYDLSIDDDQMVSSSIDEPMKVMERQPRKVGLW